MIQAIDDFLICSTSLEDLIRQLEIINKVASKYHVVFNANKVEVGPELVFTGMLIRCRPDGAPIIAPDPKNVQALMAIPEPANKRELRQFLGLANTLAKYTSEHQKRCSLLYKFVNHFTSKKAWTVEHSRLFLDIKKW